MTAVRTDRALLHKLPAPARSLLAAGALRALDAAKWSALRAYPLFEATATQPIPRWAEPLGARAALRAALHAYQRVPAYRQTVDASGWSDDPSASGTDRLLRLPITDKAGYILPHSTPSRCIDGRIPLLGTEMDESSGSSGTPFNWVRGAPELDELHRQISQFARYAFRGQVVTVNGFSMGAWSTGVNTAAAMRRNGLVKSPGPDLEKIIGTLRFLGPGYRYVITGYPPFLRELLEHGDHVGFDWTPYRMHGIVGGEGMSEQLRERLLTRFDSVYSAYGASDLDIGVASETPIGIWLRQQAMANPELRRQLFGDDPRLPMVFQFNPLDYNVEVVHGELVITVSRLCMLSPRIRYNIHDSGGAHTFQTVTEICRGFGLDPLSVPCIVGREHLRLPFLFVHGRSDLTVSYMGANIYPEDVEQALLAEPATAERIGGFCLELREIGEGAVRPCVHVEVTRRAQDDEELRSALRSQVVEHLKRSSSDFRAAVAENPTAAEILIELHEPRSGPFAGDGRIKRRYILGGH